MTLEVLAFWAFAITLVGAGLAVVIGKNLFHSVLWLALALLPDHPGSHGVGQSPRLHADFGHVRQVNLRHVILRVECGAHGIGVLHACALL